ncbi:MAG: D-alanine--D-alanine ligase [Patescibacteria group bacterium]
MRSPKSKGLRVAVLCGGVSSEREISLRSGAQVIKHLPASYKSQLIEISANGRWLLPTKIAATNDKALVKKNDVAIAQGFDIVFIALHGKYGEDGRVQALLELSGIPYTGSGVLASALAMDKFKTQELLRATGIQSPKTIYASRSTPLASILRNVRAEISFPCVVKPNESGSSLGVTIVEKPAQLKSAIQHAFEEDTHVLIQERIVGRELTCGVMGNTERTEMVPLPPIEIIPDGTFFDYTAKYTSKKTKEICPARIGARQTHEVQKLAIRVHTLLGCDGLTRSDFILTESGELYFLEVNTIPGLTEQSLCPKEAQAMGLSFTQFLEKLIDLAQTKWRS